MPRVSAYAQKRKFVKRRKFVARARKPGATILPGVRNRAGINNNPFVSLSNRVSTKNTFPPSMRRTVKYCQIDSITSGTGLLGTQQAYLMNSIYDTWGGVGGHQPYGHDTIATMYNRYKVLGCRVQLVFTTPGGANDMICCMAPSSNTSSGMTGLQLYQVQEWPQSVCGILPSSGERRCVLQATYDMATIAGVSKAAYLAEEDYAAAIDRRRVKQSTSRLTPAPSTAPEVKR